MTFSTLLWRNLRYYWRTNVAVIVGVATAVAVLAGALLVGDSVRGSLRDLVLGRLGRTDSIIAGTNFFRAALAGELKSPAYAMIALEGVVAHSSGRTASKVAIYGVDDGFWKFHGVALHGEAPSARTVRLSPALADEFGAKEGDSVVLRLDKPSDIPLESLHGRKDESVRTIRFTAGKPLPSDSLGEFALRPQQAAVRALFVSLPRLQRELQQQGKANLILVSGPTPDLSRAATLEDMGIRIKRVGDQLSIETSGMIVNQALEKAIRDTAPAQPVLTYLVNTIRTNGRQVPYSLVAALDTKTIVPGADGLILNDWTARELNAKPGDTVQMDYYVWTDGRIETRSTEMKLSAVTPIQGAAADRNYAPEYPGITEANTIHDWDPPFPMELNRIRKQDEDYWDRYRTTPKAFLPIAKGQQLWGSRFGNVTSMRVSGNDPAAFAQALRAKLDPAAMGLAVVPVRADGLAASRGATDFGEYFLYFSFFLVVSALLLVGLFFRLGVEQRYRELGLLRALGFPVAQLSGLFLREGAVLAAIGSVIGIAAAAAYAWFILYGLRTWWVDAVGTRLLQLHVNPISLVGGALGGLLTALAVVFFTMRRLRASSPRALMQGSAGSPAPKQATRAKRIAILCALLGAACLAAAIARVMDPAGGFFGAGALFLIAALAAQRLWLAGDISQPTTIWRLGLRNATYRPGRSVLSIALIAFATFLILALTAFRQEGASNDPAKRPGTGGYALVGESVLPVIHNPGAAAGRAELAFPQSAESLFANTQVVPLRLRPGDDASCLNLYAPRNPRVLGVPRALIDTAEFPLADHVKWSTLLDPGPVIPAFVDANSLQYVLHKSVGDEIEVGGARFRIEGALKDSIFQGELIISEDNFKRAFPNEQGYRMFLVRAPLDKTAAITQVMEDRLTDYGLDLKGTVERLNEFHRVENAYLSTFQALGGLGLLLGTIGLGAVLLRNVLERRKELALLRAVGYQPKQLASMVLAENTLLLACGLAVGAVCAALAIAPALIERGKSLPLPAMALLLIAVFAAGMIASVAAVKAALRSPLLSALRSE